MRRRRTHLRQQGNKLRCLRQDVDGVVLDIFRDSGGGLIAIRAVFGPKALRRCISLVCHACGRLVDRYRSVSVEKAVGALRGTSGARRLREGVVSVAVMLRFAIGVERID